MRRLLVLAILAPAIAFALAPAAARADALSDAARALAREHVYVAPGGTLLSPGDQRALRAEISRRALDLYIAELPASAGAPDDVTRRLGRALGGGTLLTIVGREVRAGSTALPPGEAGRIERRAVLAHRDNPRAALLQFIRDVDAAQGNAGAAPSGGPDGGGGSSAALLFLLIPLAGIGFFAFSRRRRRDREQRAALEQARAAARDDLVALGEDIRALDIDTQMPGVDSQVRADYERAVSGYTAADDQLDRARSIRDLAGLGERVEDARYALACVHARLDGRPVPARRPPCFFDPRHGPSATDADWAPPGGATRAVPVCAACATNLAEGRQPNARHVATPQGLQPWWAAPAPYAGYYGGYFSPWAAAGAGFLGGLLVGETLSPPMVYADPSWTGDPGGGDLGGGDFGGGDFGGGDFGGGDFGGGF